MIRHLTIAGVLLLAWAGGVHAQTGGLRVVVLDEADQRPLPGATVTLSHASRAGAPASVLSDARGEAVFPVLPTGDFYIVEVAFPGYARVRLTDLRVRIGEVRALQIVIGREQQETVVVRGRPEVVELDKSSTSTKFSDAFLQDLPVLGRFYQNMLTLAPGVLDSDNDGNPNVHGARSRDFKMIVGGVSNQDPLTGQWLSYVNPESISEIEIITAGAGAEYGRAQGGFGRIVQKEGSNQFEGVVAVLYRSSDFDGTGAADLNAPNIQKFEWFQPSLQISGPIVKNRAWFRLSHEYLDIEEPVNILNQLAISEQKQTINADQITWQVSPRNKIALQYQYDPVKRTNVDITSRLRPESSRRIETGAPTYTLTWTAPYSPRFLVDSLVSYQDYHQDIFPMTTGVPNNCVFGVSYLARAYCVDLISGSSSGSYYQSWQDERQRLTVKSTFTLYGGRFLGANHLLKFGFSVENERYHRVLDRSPDITMFPLEDPVKGREGGFEPPTVVSARFAVPVISSARALGNNWALFAEDQVKPANNLVVTLGLRLDFENIDSAGFIPFDPAAESAEFLAVAREVDARTDLDEREKSGLKAAAVQQIFTAYEGLQDILIDISRQMDQQTISPSAEAVQGAFWSTTRRPGNIHLRNTNLSPRIAVSWDPWNNGKTKFALTGGRYYDKIFLAVPLIELEPATTSILFGTTRFQGKQFASPDPGPINPAFNVEMVDRGLRTPFKDEYSFTFERELATETSIKLTYIRSRYEDQLQDIDINKVPGDHGFCVIPRGPGLTRNIAPSPGMGKVLTDPYTGEKYVDDDPGDGDGRLDDCAGELFLLGTNLPENVSTRSLIAQRRDGILDLYTLNPAWGNVHLVGNFNTTDYRAYVLELVRRMHRNWELEASYTYSRAIGDAEDFLLALGDDRTTLRDERGFLGYDQRHVVKVNATTVTRWFRLGGAVTWQSGLPYSLIRRDLSFDTIPPIYAGLGSPDPFLRTRYITGKRNDQRNRSFWNFDVRVAKEFDLRGINFQFTAEIFNLLNDDTLRISEELNRSVAGTRRFGRRFQFGARLAF